jgi:DNA methylase
MVEHKQSVAPIEPTTLHQIAPYIGRLRVSMATRLVAALSKPGDLVVDPFVGAGTIALEAAATGRPVLCSDWNPYAFVLTKAKLFHPRSHSDAVRQFEYVWRVSRSLLKRQDLRAVPLWVRAFFHNETLRSALAFRDACVKCEDDFMLACLLGILHHERPGFLSYPSSHLVPYLRTKKYPPHQNRNLYEVRDVKPRMLAKIRRTLRFLPSEHSSSRRIMLRDARHLPRIRNIRAVITSPPYMNELDYIRDNRLRLWFIDKDIPEKLECRAFRSESEFARLLGEVFGSLSHGICRGGYIAMVLGDVSRGSHHVDAARVAIETFSANEQLRSFVLKHRETDRIPDLRRSRRECSGTKVETLLVFQRRGP